MAGQSLRDSLTPIHANLVQALPGIQDAVSLFLEKPLEELSTSRERVTAVVKVLSLVGQVSDEPFVEGVVVGGGSMGTKY